MPQERLPRQAAKSIAYSKKTVALQRPLNVCILTNLIVPYDLVLYLYQLQHNLMDSLQ